MAAQTPRRRRADATPGGGVVDLLSEILFGQPRLTGAACRGSVALFDRAVDGDREAAEKAVAVCQSCPVITECAAWAERAFPKRRPGGVIGAVYTPPPTSRKKKTA
ncbi:MAG: WhiB family transcriptional regulator [Mycolicibacter algericus]|uniref:WhiB family transcriptional regulator n=1 Tax=Mycolicibacter algericus TaxID=1288388 RepID=UPI003C70FF8F